MLTENKTFVRLFVVVYIVFKFNVKSILEHYYYLANMIVSEAYHRSYVTKMPPKQKYHLMDLTILGLILIMVWQTHTNFENMFYGLK